MTNEEKHQSEELTPAMQEALARVNDPGAMAAKAADGLGALLAAKGIQPISAVPSSDTVVCEGVTYTMRKPGGANYIRAVELAGKNNQLISVFECLLCIAGIDGVPEPLPSSRLKIDALADRVGRRGIDELANWYQRTLYPEVTEAIEIASKQGIDINSDEFATLVNEVKTARLKK